MSNILAFDLGTSIGWAANLDDQYEYGNKLLATQKELRYQKKLRFDRRDDIRICRLWVWCSELERIWKPDIVIWEDVIFSSTTYATQLWASLRTTIWLAFGASAAILDCVPVTTLKKFATGNGHATKEDMVASARLNPGKFNIQPKLTDDEADALALHRWAESHYK